MDAKEPSDLLYGLAEIADHLNLCGPGDKGRRKGIRRAKHRARTGAIPTFKMGRTVCALKSAIAEKLEADQSAGGGQHGSAS